MGVQVIGFAVGALLMALGARALCRADPGVVVHPWRRPGGQRNVTAQTALVLAGTLCGAWAAASASRVLGFVTAYGVFLAALVLPQVLVVAVHNRRARRRSAP